MPPLEAVRSRALVCLGCAGLLVLVATVLIPPGSLPYPPESSVSDAAIVHWPAASFLRESVWRHGAWPLWNPLRMLGQPFAANPLNKVWYPPQWLVLAVPPTLHLNLLIYLHMAWLALGMVAWARAENLHPLAAAFAAIGWGLNPKLVAHLGAGHLDIVYALAWMPWLLWAVRRMVVAAGEGSTEPLPAAILTGTVAAMLALADLRVAFYMLPAAAVYGIAGGAQTVQMQPHTPAPFLQRRGGVMSRPWVALATGGGVSLALFLLLTAAQTVPLAALGHHLTRAAITPAEAAGFSLPPRYLLGLLVADAGGFHEWMNYVGLPVIVLAVAALLRRERRIESLAWLVLGAVALLWALGEHTPLFVLAAKLPLVSWFRVPSRAWLVTALALVALAARGLDGLLAHGAGRWGRLAGVGMAAGGAVWAAAALIIFPQAPALAGAGAALAASGIGLWLCSSKQRAVRSGGAITLLGTLAISLIVLDATLVEGRRFDDVTAADNAVITALGPFCDTVYSPSFDLIGPAAAQAGIPTLHGADPFQLAWSAAAIAEAAGVELQGYSIAAPPLPAGADDPATALRDAQPDADRLAALGVALVVSRFPIDHVGLSLREQVGGVYLYETRGSAPLFVAPEAVDAPLVPEAQRTHAACDRHPNRLLSARYEALPAGGSERVIMVLPQAWAPGWKACVDGARVPVQQVGGVLVGVEVPALGEHTIEVVYRPAADLIGLAISGGTVIALGVWHVQRRRLKHQGTKERRDERAGMP